MTPLWHERLCSDFQELGQPTAAGRVNSANFEDVSAAEAIVDV